MKNFWHFCFLLGLTAGMFGQTITGTVSDTSGTAWGNAVVHAHLDNPVGGKVVVTSTGANQPTDFVSAGGSFSFTLTNTSLLSPGGTAWKIIVCPFIDKQNCTVVSTLINAGSQDLSTQIAATLNPFVTTGLQIPGAYSASNVTPPTFGTCWLNSNLHCFINGSDTIIGGGSGTPLSGAIADYNFTEGGGTVVHDISGHGNNAALASSTNAPVWVPQGLSFTLNQNVVLPSNINTVVQSGGTFIAGIYTTSLGTQGLNPNLHNQFPLLISNTLGTTGWNFLLTYISAVDGNLQGSTYTIAPSIYAGGDIANSNIYVPGFHVLAVVMTQGQNDQIYVDGQPAPFFGISGNSLGRQTSGNLTIGSNGTFASGTSGFDGIMYRLTAFSSSLTASQVQNFSAIIASDIKSRAGAQLFTFNNQVVTPTINCIGDSITIGLGTVDPYCSFLTLTNQPTYTINNYGISGITMQSINANEPNRVALVCKSSAGPVIASVFAGTNDFATTFTTPTVSFVMTQLSAEIQTLKNSGCIPFVGTMLSRQGSTTAGPTLEVEKAAYNKLIISSAVSAGAKGIIDFAADPLLGEDGAFANTTWFQVDGTHPTTLGQTRLAQIYSNTINYYFGNTVGNPTVATAATYQMLSSDAYVVADPTAAGQVITLPDCIGPTGATYTVMNINGGVFSTSVKGGTFNTFAEKINTQAIATTVSIANGSSATFTSVRVQNDNSGCQWLH